MNCRLLAVAFALALTLVAARAEAGAQCVGGGDGARLSLSSSRNATGHWLATLRLEQTAPAGRPARLLQVDVEPSSWRCGAQRTDAVTLQIQGHPPSSSPPADFESLHGFGYYKLHKPKMDWKYAKAVCESENAHLLILQSEAEALIIKDLISRSSGVSGYLHIGFTYNVEKNAYFTILDEPLDDAGYTKWAPNEPSSQGEENCGSINNIALLNDIKCTNDPMSFICEYNLE